MTDRKTVASGVLEVAFGSSPLTINSITDSQRAMRICRNGVQELLVRPSGQVSEPVFLRKVDEFRIHDGVARFSLSDEHDRYRADAEVGPSPHGLKFSARVSGPVPIWMIEWQLRGFPLDEVIIPALGGQSVKSDMPDGSRLAYKYPFWWNAQFAIGSTGRGAGIWWRTMETDPRLKLLRVERDRSAFDVTLGFEAAAPLRKGEVAGEFFVDAYAGGWQGPVDVHRDWLREAFGLVPYGKHRSFPHWAREINLVLELWGMRRDRGRPGHTFDEMVERIDAFARRHPPSNTLLYLPGFAQGGIDSNIPNYDPAERLGGDDGFARLVDTAHVLGYRVMIHTNVLGMTYNHPLYVQFAEHQVVDVFDRPQGWAMDLDGDWLTEPYFAYINPGARDWSDLMTEVLGRLIRRFDIDAVFLDQTLLAFNVSRGPNFLTGMRAHVERLQNAFPDVLFAGEGINEHVLPALPMVQIHGIDSIAGVHGMEDGSSWRKVHPVLTYLFGPHTKFVGHLLTKHPSHPVFEAQESAYAQLGVLPALVCYDSDEQLWGAFVDAVIERARNHPAV